MNLIIVADLTERPTEILFFRFLTLSVRDNLKLDCLLETQQELKDAYYNFLKRQGSMDYISQIITPPENEFGIRLDKELNFPLTIKTKAITCVNVVNILGQIKMLSRI